MSYSLTTPAFLATALTKTGVSPQLLDERETAKGRGGRFTRTLCLAAAAVGLVCSAHAGAQAIKEYPIPTPNSYPTGIAADPDGALWFTEEAFTSLSAPLGLGKIGRITTAGAITEFLIPTPASGPTAIAAGPDGALWFLEPAVNKIARISTSGAITEYLIPSGGPSGISAGPDGALWFTYGGGQNTIGRITTAGALSLFSIPESMSRTLGGPVAGPDGAMWFTDTAILPVSLPGAQPSKIGRITTSGMVAEYAIPTLSFLNAIAVGPDGALWFTEETGQTDKIGRITASGGAVTQYVTEYDIPTLQSDPVGIAAGADGALWFAEFGVGKIGRITTAGDITEYALPPSALPFGITSGANNALWFTLPNANEIGTFTTGVLTVAEAGTGGGTVTSNVPVGGEQIDCSATSTRCTLTYMAGFPVTLTASAASGSTFSGWSGGGCSGTATCTLTPASGGNTAVTASFAQTITSFMLSIAPAGTGSGTVTSTPSGIVCATTCSASFSSSTQITLTASAGNNSTFAGWSGAGCSGIQTCIVSLGANTVVTATFVQNSTTNTALYASVLPESRSVEVGATATAFATIINAGPGDASTCTIAPQASLPASFLFQTTNPSTNAVTGTANTPVDIAHGAAQSFVIAFTPNAAIAPTDVAFNFACANAAPAPVSSGISTLEFSASTSPVPDIVALAASGDPGYVDIPGATGTGPFAVATVNLGIAAQITVSADTGTANLPVVISICQTNPTTGACLATLAANVTTTIAANATPTFGIFVTGSAAVPDSPGANRVFVRFTDAGGALRGQTSVAARTQ